MINNNTRDNLHEAIHNEHSLDKREVPLCNFLLQCVQRDEYYKGAPRLARVAIIARSGMHLTA